ncbi:MAG: hypothetical protein ISR83_04565 [Candidatus Marinimicrobia bacterium]|nr:hypothetical protein [Candidatus Neomarinimicrobiota bacterium]
MTQTLFRDALLKGDTQSIYATIQGIGESPQNVVPCLSDLFDVAVSIEWNSQPSDHPIIVLNSIKNLISDVKETPSLPLIEFAIECVQNRSYRKNDHAILDGIQIDQSVFVSDVQDALIEGNPNIVQPTAHLYLASDRSQSILEVIAEILLRDYKTFGLLTFHLMRAFAFQEKKESLWSFILTLIYQSKSRSFNHPAPDQNGDVTDKIAIIIHQNDTGNINRYSTMLRFWNSEYVRVNQIKNEILEELNSLQYESLTEMSKSSNHWICEGPNYWSNQFIVSAEKVIQSNSQLEEKMKKIVALESLRTIGKICDKHLLPYLGDKIEKVTS